MFFSSHLQDGLQIVVSWWVTTSAYAAQYVQVPKNVPISIDFPYLAHIINILSNSWHWFSVVFLFKIVSSWSPLAFAAGRDAVSFAFWVSSLAWTKRFQQQHLHLPRLSRKFNKQRVYDPVFDLIARCSAVRFNVQNLFRMQGILTSLSFRPRCKNKANYPCLSFLCWTLAHSKAKTKLTTCIRHLSSPKTMHCQISEKIWRQTCNFELPTFATFPHSWALQFRWRQP